MSGPYASKADLAAHRWLLEQLYTQWYRQQPDPVAFARAYAEYADGHWSEMAQHSLGDSNPDLFHHIIDAGGEVRDILSTLADDFEEDAKGK